MVKVVKMYASHRRNTRQGTNGKKYVTVHFTGNRSRGADARAHGKLQASGNVRVASWHETVDDKEAVLSFPPEVKCFHAGDGLYGPGNNDSYAIELCENEGYNYAKVLDNGARRAAFWLKEFGLGIKGLKQHYDWSGKNCPGPIRSRGDWKKFRNLVKKYLKNPAAQGKVEEVVNKTPVSPPKTQPNVIDEDGLWGMDTTGLLQRVLGTPEDRLVSSQSNYWRKRNPGLTSGWQWVVPSKSAGSQVILAHQKLLKKRGLYKGELEGKAGREYITALQRDMGTTPDGEIWRNSPAVKAMQRRLNQGKI